MTNTRYGLIGLASLTLAACGPGFSPASAPGEPCPEITEAEFNAFSKTGSAKAVAKVSEAGIIDMTTGPGQVQCASGNGAAKPCRRPNPLVIRYEFANGSSVHVRVPAETEYRFRVGAQPTSCEIVKSANAA